MPATDMSPLSVLAPDRAGVCAYSVKDNRWFPAIAGSDSHYEKGDLFLFLRHSTVRLLFNGNRKARYVFVFFVPRLMSIVALEEFETYEYLRPLT